MELQAMLSQRDLTSSFAENLLKQIEKCSEDEPKVKIQEKLEMSPTNDHNHKNASIEINTNAPAIFKHEIKSEPILKFEKLEFAEKIKFNNRMSSREILEAVKWVNWIMFKSQFAHEHYLVTF